MGVVRRAALTGAGFGIAVALAGTWFGLVPVWINRLPPSPSLVLSGVLFEVALATALGTLLAPLLALPGRLGRLAHLGGLVAAWTAIQLAYEFDSPVFGIVARFGGLAALVIYAAGVGISRRSRWAGAISGVVLLAAGVAAPHVFLALTTPERSPLAELPPAAPGAPDVVLIVLDTVRAQNMSAYGYARETTPRFDALAREGALYLDATSPSTWSLASHASLFTGLFPSTHGAHFEHRFLDDGPPTLAETLEKAGYETITFTANAFISDTIGLTRGFRQSDESWRAGQAGRQFSFTYRVLDSLGFGVDDKGGGVVATDFESWAEERSPDDPPAFVFVNFIEAHFPYHQLPQDYLRLYTGLPRAQLRDLSMQLMGAQFGGAAPPAEIAMRPSIDMYDGGIVYTDHLLGRIVDALQRRGTLDDTVLIVMSDHGELLGEHGAYGHGAALYEPGIRVPLLVRYPGRVPAGARVETPISTVGVFATILDLLDLEPPGPLHVSSLLPVISGGAPGGPVISERHMTPVGVAPEDVDPMADSSARIRTYRIGSWKLVETSKGETFLFDLDADPGEARDVTAANPTEVARLVDELATWRAALGLPEIAGERTYGEVPELDPEASERLKALGYLE
jgi:arylsulfatase A-like enzyme